MGMERLTLADITRQSDPNGAPAKVMQVLAEQNPIVADAPAYPSNAQLGHQVTVQSAEPTVEFSRINQGVTRSKGATTQHVDTIGILSALADVDVRLKLVVGAANLNAARFNGEKGFRSAMNKTMALTMIYGDELTSPAAFTGLAPRMNALSAALDGSQVISMGSVVGGDGTSIMVVDYGMDGAHLIYPKDGEGAGGLNVRDLGEVPALDAEGKDMQVYRTAYDWCVGLSVEDSRHIGRLCNIDLSDANLDIPTQGRLTMALIDLLNSMPDTEGMQRVMYCDRRISAAFQKQALNNANTYLTMQEYLGKLVPHFWGVPIRRVDQMSVAESTVS